MDNALIIDLVLAAVLAVFALLGARKGLIRSLMALVSVVVALIGATLLTAMFVEPVTDLVYPKVEERVLEQFERDIPSDALAAEDGDLSAGHARALLGISDEKLLSETAAKAAEGKLTVRAVEKIAADGEKPGKMPQFSHKDSFYKEIEISLESRLGRRVTVTAGKNKGTLNLEFYDKDDLSALAQKLTRE